jgi:DNA-binding NtrC family response regulator
MKRPTRILIVDDDPLIGKMLSRSLSRHGYEVETFESAEDALAKAEDADTRFDAALIDLVMPGRGGADLAETLRRILPGLPIAILTGYAHSPLIPKPEKSGMAVFTKPVIIQELVEFLHTEVK